MDLRCVCERSWIGLLLLLLFISFTALNFRNVFHKHIDMQTHTNTQKKRVSLHALSVLRALVLTLRVNLMRPVCHPLGFTNREEDEL